MNASNHEGENRMQEQIQGLHVDVGQLKDWRRNVVDPHIIKGTEFEGSVREFMTAFKAREEEKSKREEIELELQKTQHRQNTEKSNMILIGIGVLTLFLAALTCLFGYIAIRPTLHSSLFNLQSNNQQVETAQDARIPSMK